MKRCIGFLLLLIPLLVYGADDISNKTHHAQFIFHRSDASGTIIDDESGDLEIHAYPEGIADTTGEGTQLTYSYADSSGFWYAANMTEQIYQFYIIHGAAAGTLMTEYRYQLIPGRAIGEGRIADSCAFMNDVVTANVINDDAVRAAHVYEGDDYTVNALTSTAYVTADSMDTQHLVVDVEADLPDNQIDGTNIQLASEAAGDVMYCDGTNWVRLAKGTAGQVLEMNAGATAPEWDTDDSGGAASLDIMDGGVVISASPTALDLLGADFVVSDATTADSVNISIADAGIDHDATTNFVANEHLDWTASVGTIHTGNYVENVSTTLTAGTVNATTYGITSDGGADDIVLPEADTDNAGLLSADKWDEIVANTAKDLSLYLLLASFDDSVAVTASTELTDTADILYEAELDAFSELQTQIADKTLINEEDVCTIDANWVNTANPWAVNEVHADLLTATEGNAAYLLLTSFDDSLATSASTELTDTADILYEAELDAFSELQAQISDKALVNTSDAANMVLATVTGTVDAGGATSLEIPNGTDPDLTEEGQLSNDTDGANETSDAILRGRDGSNQYAYARKLKTIHGGVIAPNDLADATRDKCPTGWSNETGMTFTITRIIAMSDTDDTDFVIKEFDADGASNEQTVDAIQCTTGSGPYTDEETVISHATIEDGHTLFIDHDDTDTPGWVTWTIIGWYNADVD